MECRLGRYGLFQDSERLWWVRHRERYRCWSAKVKRLFQSKDLIARFKSQLINTRQRCTFGWIEQFRSLINHCEPLFIKTSRTLSSRFFESQSKVCVTNWFVRSSFIENENKSAEKMNHPKTWQDTSGLQVSPCFWLLLMNFYFCLERLKFNNSNQQNFEFFQKINFKLKLWNKKCSDGRLKSWMDESIVLFGDRLRAPIGRILCTWAKNETEMTSPEMSTKFSVSFRLTKMRPCEHSSK